MALDEQKKSTSSNVERRFQEEEFIELHTSFSLLLGPCRSMPELVFWPSGTREYTPLGPSRRHTGRVASFDDSDHVTAHSGMTYPTRSTVCHLDVYRANRTGGWQVQSH